MSSTIATYTKVLGGKQPKPYEATPKPVEREFVDLCHIRELEADVDYQVCFVDEGAGELLAELLDQAYTAAAAGIPAGDHIVKVLAGKLDEFGNCRTNIITHGNPANVHPAVVHRLRFPTIAREG